LRRGVCGGGRGLCRHLEDSRIGAWILCV
jgi:hypothetical protein